LFNSISRSLSELKQLKITLFIAKNETFIWTFLGFSVSNVLRLLSSLILTRIFLPDQFGMMAILISIMVGAELLSDVGIQTSIIRNNNDKDRVFLKTAWTLSVIRGFILCISLVLFSNYFSQLFNATQLANYLYVMSTIFVLKGLRSTSLAMHIKNQKIKTLTKLELSTQVFALITTLSLAAYYQSLWAFITSMILTEIIFTLSTYLYLKNGVTGFVFSKNHIMTITKFGKWLFIASILTFITGQGDRFLLGLYLSKEELGVYHVAATLAALPVMLHGALLSKVFFPSICSKLDQPINEFNVTFNKLRKKVVMLTFPIAALLSVFGQVIISFLYNENYQNAGWMLQVLSIGAMFRITGDSISPILNAKGDSFRRMIYIGFWALLILLSIVVGNYYFQLKGILLGMAISPFFSLIFLSFLSKKYVEVNHLLSFLLSLFSIVMFSIVFKGM
jgi:O-antigen/teichoic acid export membrane protein